MSEVVPFGKYKGRSIEELLADAEYLAWLQGQPWFRERYRHWLNKAEQDAMARTPKHNKMQALFLDERYCRAFARRADANRYGELVRKSQFDEGLAQHLAEQTREMRRAAEGAEIKRASARFFGTDAAQRRVKECEQFESDLRDYEFSLTVKARFESDFADVVVRIVCLHAVLSDPGSYQIVSPLSAMDSWDLRIEAKPVVADDYPAVLRQMARNKSTYLFVGSYQGEGVTEAQFIAMFKASGRTVVFKRDVDAHMSEPAT